MQIERLQCEAYDLTEEDAGSYSLGLSYRAFFLLHSLSGSTEGSGLIWLLCT